LPKLVRLHYRHQRVASSVCPLPSHPPDLPFGPSTQSIHGDPFRNVPARRPYIGRTSGLHLTGLTSRQVGEISIYQHRLLGLLSGPRIVLSRVRPLTYIPASSGDSLFVRPAHCHLQARHVVICFGHMASPLGALGWWVEMTDLISSTILKTNFHTMQHNSINTAHHNYQLKRKWPH